MEATLPHDEESRLAALASYQILDTLPEQTYDDLTLLASSICDTPMALITFIDQERQWFKARVGVDVDETPRSEAFCAHTILQPQEMMIVPDARQDHRFADNPFVQGEPHIRFYAGAPLVTPDGHALGTICVIDNTSRQLTEQQKRSLQALARQVMVHLELRRSAVQLERTHKRQQEAELAIQKSEERFRSLIEHSSDMIGLVSREGTQLYASPSVKQWLGYEPEELVGQNVFSLIHPEDLPRMQDSFAILLTSEKIETHGFRLRAADGQWHWIDTVATNMLERPGIEAIVICSRDITWRKQAEEAKHFLASIVESSEDSILTINFERVITSWNKAAERLYGYSAEEVLGQPLTLLTLPQDLQQVLRNVDRIKHSQAVETFDTVRVNKDGRELNLEVVLSPVKNAAGEVIGVSTIARDITQRKQVEQSLRQSEEMNRSMLESSSDCIKLLDLDGMILSMNVSGKELMEIEDFGQVTGRCWSEFWTGGGQELARAAVETAKAGGSGRFQGECQTFKGTLKWWDVAVTPIFGEQSQPIRLVVISRDITESKRVEQQLQLHSHLLNLIGQAVIVTDAAGIITYWNNFAQQLYGWSSAEVLARNIAEVVSPDASQAQFAEAISILASGRIWSGELVAQKRDGTPVLIDVTGTPVLDEAGRASSIISISVDISERKQAEQALQRSNDELEQRVMERTAQLQASNQALVDNEARLLRGNSIFTDLTRLRVTSQTELQGALEEVTQAGSALLDVERCSVWLFDDNKSALRCLDLFQRSSQQHSSGTVLLVEEYPAYFGHPGTRAAIVAHDVHAHPAMSEFSEGYLRPLGITSLIDAPIVVAGMTVGVVCCEHVGPARHWQVEEQTFAAAVASICALSIESVERARAEALSRQAKEEAESAYQEARMANEAKSEFLSRMSHELRTPLNAILGFGQILDRQQLNALQQESVVHILKAGRHLLGLIDEVLDVSRVEAGSAKLLIEAVDLEDVVNEAFALVNPLAAQHGVYIELNRRTVRSIFPLADRQRLRQVMINLLSNAIKYNHPGGRVVVSAQRVDGDRLRIGIADSGQGLSPQELEKLFTPFERLNAANSVIEGTGLGLVISMRLITAMGGTLGVESEVGTGSTFWIELPLAHVSNEPLTGSGNSELELGLTEPRPHEMKTARNYAVLSIEDNLSNMRLIEAILASRPEITLLGAMQGSIGLDMAREHRPDVILLDLHLPGLSGNEVLEQLQRSDETKDIPVIVISADATAKQIERLLAAGAIAYLTKPLDVAAFLSTLEDVLQAKG